MKATPVKNMKKGTVTAVLGTVLLVGTATAGAADMSRGANGFHPTPLATLE